MNHRLSVCHVFPKHSPWKKAGNVNSWRKWLHVESDEPLPESAVTLFRVVQANWASPEKIAGRSVGGHVVPEPGLKPSAVSSVVSCPTVDAI